MNFLLAQTASHMNWSSRLPDAVGPHEILVPQLEHENGPKSWCVIRSSDDMLPHKCIEFVPPE